MSEEIKWSKWMPFSAKYLLLIPAIVLPILVMQPYTVDAGETAIVTKYGEIVDVRTSGLNWKWFIEDVQRFSMREQKIEFGSFSENGDVLTGISAYTSDIQTVLGALVVTYKIKSPEEVYKRFRTTDIMVSQLIAPRVRESFEIVFSSITASKAMELRGSLSPLIIKELRQKLEDSPIEILSVQAIINFDKNYEAKVEESVRKNIDIQTKERELIIEKRAAEITVTKAQAEADKEIINAKAEAEKIKLKGEAEAYAIKVKSEALRNNPELIQLTIAEKWEGKLPQTMLPNNSLPLINLPINKGEK